MISSQSVLVLNSKEEKWPGCSLILVIFENSMHSALLINVLCAFSILNFSGLDFLLSVQGFSLEN